MLDRLQKIIHRRRAYRRLFLWLALAGITVYLFYLLAHEVAVRDARWNKFVTEYRCEKDFARFGHVDLQRWEPV